MRRVFMLLIILVFSVVSAVADDFGYTIRYVADTDVNVRDAEKTVVGFLRKGTVVEVTGKEGGFLVINYTGQKDLAYAQYFHIGHAEELEAWDNQTTTAIPVDTAMARFIGTCPDGATVYSKDLKTKIGSFEAGEEVFVRQLGRYWYKVIYDGHIGYVQAKKITLEGPNVPGDGENRYVIVPGGQTAYVYEDDARRQVLSKFDSQKPVCGVKLVEILPGGWAKVLFGPEGNEGYMRSKYLKKSY